MPSFQVFVGDGSGFGVELTQFQLEPVGSTTIDLGFAEGTVSLGDAAEISLDSGTNTVRGIDTSGGTAHLEALVGMTLKQDTALFTVMAFQNDADTNTGTLLLKRLSKAPSVGGGSATLVEHNVTGESFGNRIQRIGSGFAFDLWFSDAPSFVADSGHGFEGFGAGITNAALTADSIIRMSDGSSFYLEGTEVLKGGEAIGSGLTVQSSTIDPANGQLTLTMSDTVSGVADKDAVVIAGRDAKVVGTPLGSAFTVEFIGTVTAVAQGSVILRLSDGSSINLKGVAALAEGLTVQGVAYDAGGGQAVLEISDDIPAEIELGTGVRIAGLEGVVTDLNRTADTVTVAFIGELRPVAQGSGVRVALPLDAGVAHGGTKFDVTDARLVPDSDTIRLTLVEAGNPFEDAADIQANNTALGTSSWARS